MTFERHNVFGLAVESAIALPDLPRVAPAGPADVTISRGTIPPVQGEEAVGLYVAPHGTVLNIPGVARYLMIDGRRIVVEAALEAHARNVRLYLLGSAFGAILHQRHLLPLHANTIDFGGTAVAFMGHSGAGKSTLANWFRDRDFAILSDDVCVVRTDPAGRLIAEPGLPRIRLWVDALEASGRHAKDYETSFDDMDKYDVPVGSDLPREPEPLGAIYLLLAAEAGQDGSITQLTGIDAVEALVANTYRGAYLPMMGGVGEHLAQCVALARRVPVFALQRRWGLDVFAEEAAVIADHVRGVLAA